MLPKRHLHGFTRLAGAGLLAFALHAPGQSAEVPGHVKGLLDDNFAPQNASHLTVTTPSFQNGGNMPRENQQYGGNVFPGLTWSAGPAGTKSYFVIVQGLSLQSAQGTTSVHLTVYDIPPDVTTLPRNMKTPPGDAELGPNVHGTNEIYIGPHAHPGATNGYHFEVLALDTTLPKKTGEPLDDLLAQLKGHVLAAGEIMAVAAYDPTAPDANTTLPGPVKVDTGMLEGTPGRDPAITAFKGVPYAAPPVGDLRFHAPEPPKPWQGVFKADHFSKMCPQQGQMGPENGPQDSDPSANMSEDCLYANIWTGARSPSERRPVFVWIYGGGFTGGTGSSPMFDGEALASKGVIVVTFNYRIGVLGFLATPELSRESGHNASGNYGLLDDVAMLQWVQRNIEAFGGDPKNVTIGGQSAGAGSVGFLAMSPLAKGLFERGIQESHARYSHDTELRYLSVSYRTLKTAEEQGKQFAQSRGAHSVAELRALPWQKLLTSGSDVDNSVETGSDAKPPLFRPVVDGWVVPKNYSQTYAAGTQNNVAIIAGNNRDETGAVPESSFAKLRANPTPSRGGAPKINVTIAEFQSYAKRKFGPLAEEFLKLYPASTDEEAAIQSDEAARDNNRISTYLWALDWIKHDNKPLYTYYWTHRPTGSPNGASHGSEIIFVFDNLSMRKQNWTDEDKKIAETISSYWVNFISKGNPNGEGLPNWPAFNPAAKTVMEIGDQFEPIPIATDARLAFWKRFFATQPAW